MDHFRQTLGKRNLSFWSFKLEKTGCAPHLTWKVKPKVWKASETI